MQTKRSGQRGNRSRASQPAPRQPPWGKRRRAALETPTLREAETGFEFPLACCTLTHQLTLALQGEGLNATLASGASTPSEAVVVVAATDKEAAIDILLHTLSRAQWSPELPAELATTLAV
jgi:hypothetical protein